MTKVKRWVLVGLIASMPLAASACTFSIGSGCTVGLLNPGAQLQLTCNPL
jgi:hypothetical protein